MKSNNSQKMYNYIAPITNSRGMLLCVVLIFCSFIQYACSDGSSPSDNRPQSVAPEGVLAKYRGNLFVSGYDSVVNVLTLRKNESFELHQIDRLAEHELNERSHEGLYTTLNDSTQLGLYTDDGVLMLRFKMIENDLTPIDLNGMEVYDSSNLWKRQQIESN